MIQSKILRGLAATLLPACLAGVAVPAAAYPTKPVRIIVPFAPGGGTDIQARLLSKAFQQSMGQTFVVDNRTGAGGLIGGELAVAAPADGYTILFTTATIAVNVTLYGERMKFNPLTDLIPISHVSSAPLVLVVHPSVPVKSVPDLIALAKKRPDVLNNGVNTIGSTSHLSGEMFKQFANVKTQIIGFRGGGPATTAVVQGEVDLLFATAPSSMPFIRQGKLRALAVTTPKKSSAFPDLPPMNQFLPGFESDNWYAMFFPKGTSPEFVKKMNAEIRKAVQDKSVKSFMEREGIDPVGSSPEEQTALIKREIQKYADVIRKGNIKLN